MSTVYFAKFNINEKIYDVYDGKIKLEELLKKIYLEMDTELELQDIYRKKESNYKFIQLDKDPDKFVVNGRLVAYAPGVHVSYDEETDNIIETKDNKKATYVTFSFDVMKETVGFVPKVDFGRKQFIERFASLIEHQIPEIGEIEVILESDKEILNDKLKKIHHVDEVVINLIPPNNDKKLFESLFGINSEELKDTGGNRFTFFIKGSTKQGIDLASKYMKKLVNGVIIGYGNLVAKGKNTTGEPVNVNSEEHALYTRGISDHNKDSIPEISEKTRAGVISLAAMKATAKEDLIQRREELKTELLRTIDDEEKRRIE
ncbi:hypothetical protein C2I17_21085 [Niallia circulans]|uniref:hypothetical protein n=1 Tax=Niallia circulans TaxID=1397 RepID=UPI00201DAF04|nr:hypothetical protein [Niallia circulans]UQZ76836.1 hypothetical protein C2I17_21085 [Niallia circulans]